MENTVRKIVKHIKNEMCHKSIDEIKEADVIDFIENEKDYLGNYLNTEYQEGKTEFRLVVNADKSFYIHPLGKDGKTLDGKL